MAQNTEWSIPTIFFLEYLPDYYVEIYYIYEIFMWFYPILKWNKVLIFHFRQLSFINFQLDNFEYLIYFGLYQLGLRNAFQGEMVEGEDKEVVLITLKRPLIYMQPMAVDKAILVWLNYKTAYEYWNEQRTNLNNEVLTATQQVSCNFCGTRNWLFIIRV